MTYESCTEWFDLMESELDPDLEYGTLLKILHDISFRSDLSDDMARIDDAWYTRMENECYFTREPSVLEVIYAFVNRMTLVTATDHTARYYFQVILESALLSHYTDRFIKTFSIAQEEIRDRISALLDRNYAPDGAGGWFRIDNDIPIIQGQLVTDMRELGMWWQAQAWMQSNEE